MSKIKELREKRGKLIAEARAILDKAEAENRAVSTEENVQWEAMISQAEGVRADITREERQAELDREAAEISLRNEQRGQEQRGERSDDNPNATSFRKFLRGGMASLSGDELRALQAGADVEGGFLVTPEQMVSQLIKNVDDAVFIRQKATKFQIPTAASLGVPTLDTDPDDAGWTVELGTGSEDTAMRFGKRSLHPQPLAKRIKISRTLIRMVPNVESLVLGRLAYKFGITEEKHFLTGTGAKQPLGLFTASNDGITTARDVSTGNTATAITFDGLIEAKYTLKGQYWPRAEWLFHRDAIKMLAKIKDGDGQYIWRESVRAGEPDRLLNLPFTMSEYVPNTFTTQLYVGLLGDLSHYWIADAMNMQMQALFELYAETNQVGYIGRLETDGMPTLAEAFVRVKLG